eukprot:6183007-Pleurochrysis_carterae.AAC.2
MKRKPGRHVACPFQDLAVRESVGCLMPHHVACLLSIGDITRESRDLETTAVMLNLRARFVKPAVRSHHYRCASSRHSPQTTISASSGQPHSLGTILSNAWRNSKGMSARVDTYLQAAVGRDALIDTAASGCIAASAAGSHDVVASSLLRRRRQHSMHGRAKSPLCVADDLRSDPTSRSSMVVRHLLSECLPKENLGYPFGFS